MNAGSGSNLQAESHLRRWQASGDIEALDLLLRSEIDALRERLRFRGGPRLDGSFAASDLAQEAVLAWLRVEEPPSFENRAAFRAYLWTAAWRLLQARLGARARAPQRATLSASGGPAEDPAAPDAHEQKMALHIALNLLAEEDRDLLVLVYFEDLEIGAAAQRLGVGRDAANMRLVRARRRLAEKLKDWRGRIARE
jgi:RNA polymerase sigma factor (sigma-70 family)